MGKTSDLINSNALDIDQGLSTTDSPTFAGLDLTGNLTFDSGGSSEIYGGTLNINNLNGTNFSTYIGRIGASVTTWIQGNTVLINSGASGTATISGYNTVLGADNSISDLTAVRINTGTNTGNTITIGRNTMTNPIQFQTSVNVTGAITATGNVTGSNLSGTNTGDQTTITGNAGTATALETARTINGVSFDGTANITITADPNSHNNTAHSETYITSAGVTYENLSTNGDIGTGATQVAQGDHTHASLYQPLDTDLTNIAALTGTSGFLKTDGANGWSVDTNTYLTSETSHADVLVDGDFTANGFMIRTGVGTYSVDTNTYLTTADAATTYQPLDADLTAIAALAGTTGFLEKTAADTWTLNTAGATASFSIVEDGGLTTHNFVFTNGILTSYTTT